MSLNDKEVKILKKELNEVFNALLGSEEYVEGFRAGWSLIDEPGCRYEATTNEWDDFYRGYAVGLKTKRWIEGLQEAV